MKKRGIPAICLIGGISFLLGTGNAVFAQVTPVQVDPAPQVNAPFPVLSQAQLEGLVSPIALYPDPLLSQVLVASTYPLEIVDAAQWLRQNSSLTGAAAQSAAASQNWDPSVQALAVFPDVLSRMSDNIRWTTDLGNAFLAQQSAVMDAVQQLRSQAMTSGTNFLGAQIRKEHIAPVRKEQITADKTKPDTAFSGRHILELPELKCLVLRGTSSPSEHSPATMIAIPSTQRTSVLCGALDAVDYKYLNRSFRAFQFQAKLLLQGGEDGRTRRVQGPDSWTTRRTCSWIECPHEAELECSCDAGLVNHWTI